MIHPLLHSFRFRGGLLLWKEWMTELGQIASNSSSCRPRVSERFSIYGNIFLCFWSTETPKSKLQISKVGISNSIFSCCGPCSCSTQSNNEKTTMDRVWMWNTLTTFVAFRFRFCGLLWAIFWFISFIWHCIRDSQLIYESLVTT